MAFSRSSQLNRRLIENVKPNHLYTVTQGGDEPYVPPVKESTKTMFDPKLELLTVPHPQDPKVRTYPFHGDYAFDDFSYQSLLPNRFSQLGPGVAWADLNQDGYEDLIVGAGRGGTLRIYHGQAGGTFQPAQGPVENLDQTTLLAWVPKAGAAPLVLVGNSNFEEPSKAFSRPPAARTFNPANWKFKNITEKVGARATPARDPRGSGRAGLAAFSFPLGTRLERGAAPIAQPAARPDIIDALRLQIHREIAHLQYLPGLDRSPPSPMPIVV